MIHTQMSLTFRLLVLLLFSSAIPTYSQQDDVKSWCGKTPYPQPCVYHLSGHPTLNVSIDQEPDFLALSIRLALDRANLARDHTRSLGSKCRDHNEKAAWYDCLQLYDHTILMLNRTVHLQCSQTDAQTWLSTALTNLDTCHEGFAELGVTDYVFPMMSNNVSELISNALALNYAPYSPSAEYTGGLPTWLKPGDRKLLQASSPASQANIVVAQDGSGNYKTINEAITAASKRSGTSRYIIYIKTGVYNEKVEVGSMLKNIMFVGDGMGKTVITGSRSVGGGPRTFRSATVTAVGDGFIARDLTIRNTAGAAKHQAVALLSGSDLSVFYKCSIEGFQDTHYARCQRQFYHECDIYGTVDFIFGNAAVVLQSCNIYVRYPPNKTNTVTAQGRTNPNQNTGISIHNCRVTAASDLKSAHSSVKTYLGRPWREYSRTVFMKTYIDSLVDPAGWLEWSGNFALGTLYYGEYMNTGSRSSTANRVKWGGYHIINSSTEASKFTVGSFIAGNSWLPATGVAFTAGL